MIEQQIEAVVAEMPGVAEVEAELTWDPPWSPEKMSDDAKFILGFGY
jgi:metal-sulfur cluster biosynthetic enzyme